MFFQQFNEWFIALTTYHLMCFADFIEDEPTRTTVGWSMITCVSFNLLLNLSVIVFGAAKQVCRRLKIKYLKWKLEKLRERVEKKQKQRLIEILEAEGQRRQLQPFQHLFEVSVNEDLRHVPEHILKELFPDG